MKHWREHLQAAPDAETTAWRLFNGKGFRWGGIWIDNFDGHWLVQTTKDKFPEPFREAVESGEARSIYWKHREKVVKGTPQWIAGEVVKEPFPITENGITYLIDFDSGYSQGIFLDQRENRRRLMDRVQPGERILNCFAYTCAFSVVALQAGARQVVNVDMARGAIATGQQNHQLNGLAAGASFLAHDIFSTWGKITRSGPYDLVIVDPPSYQKGSFIATKDYARLLRRLPDLLAPHGHALLCLNAPELDCAFLQEQMQALAPELVFVERVANPAVFADVSEERSLKVLVYRAPG